MRQVASKIVDRHDVAFPSDARVGSNPTASALPRFRMPTYSSTPLAQKLGIKERAIYLLINPPPGFDRELPTLPANAKLATLRQREVDVILVFAPDSEFLQARVPSLIRRMAQAGALWIGWPKQASGVATDLREGVVRDTMLATGLVDVKVCSINDTYSGLKFVRRLKDRKKQAEPVRSARAGRR
jgi:hypothetical protein